VVTKFQIEKLSSRIDQVAEQLGLAAPITYRVWLVFDGESDEEFFARHPDARGPDGRRRKADVELNFGGRTFREEWNGSSFG
jgi:hypothetical protein